MVILPNGKLLLYNSEMYYKINNRIALYSDIQSVLNQAYTSSNKPYIFGSYMGNNVSDRTINIGFTPLSVLLIPSNGLMNEGQYTILGGLFGNNYNLTDYANSEFSSYQASVVENGFSLKPSVHSNNLNVTGYQYYYLCFK